MNPWTDLSRRPARLTVKTAAAWFARFADHLLNHTRFVVAGSDHRITEVEFYYRGPGHEDPFAHADPVQVHCGRWYFHKTGGVYRGGTFKGVDLTFGDGRAHGGILFRSVKTPDESFVDGPSLLVDHLLRLTRTETVADLDRTIAGRLAWDPTSPLRLVEAPNSGKTVLACARVGLSLRHIHRGSTRPQFLTRPYRFLTEPADIAKGKVQMVMALHRAGEPPERIGRLTGSPRRTVAQYAAAYEEGLHQGRFEDYFGKEIGPRDLCRLHGIADRA